MATQSDVPNGEPKEQGLLYHYTDQDGLLGILKSKSIWATHVRYLNDASEFLHGIKIAGQCVKEARIDVESFLKRHPESWPDREVPLSTANILNEYVSGSFDRLNALPVYVACFFDSEPGESPSEGLGAGDNLAQWQAYSKGSAGFSMGFEKRSLEGHLERLRKNPGDVVLFGGKCTYDEKEQRRILQKEAADINSSAVEILRRVLDRLGKSRDFDSFGDAASPALKVKETGGNPPPQMDRERALLEDIAHEMQSLTESILGVATKMVALPVSIVSSPSLIRRVVVGPSPEIDNAVAAAKMLLASAGCKVKSSSGSEGIEVLPSEIPYRDW